MLNLAGDEDAPEMAQDTQPPQPPPVTQETQEGQEDEQPQGRTRRLSRVFERWSPSPFLPHQKKKSKKTRGGSRRD